MVIIHNGPVGMAVQYPAEGVSRTVPVSVYPQSTKENHARRSSSWKKENATNRNVHVSLRAHFELTNYCKVAKVITLLFARFIVNIHIS